jgi:hypothetical protein
MTKFPSALMQKANELNYRVQNFDTYSGDDLNKTILLQKIIYHAKDLLIEALNGIDYDVEYLISQVLKIWTKMVNLMTSLIALPKLKMIKNFPIGKNIQP